MKTKKGFTLIALLIVASIFGLSALIGLRFYTGNQLSSFNSPPHYVIPAKAGIHPSFSFSLYSLAGRTQLHLHPGQFFLHLCKTQGIILPVLLI